MFGLILLYNFPAVMQGTSLYIALLLGTTWGCATNANTVDSGGPSSPPSGERRPLDLDDPGDRGLAFLLTRGSTDPEEEVVFYWSGAIMVSRSADPAAAPTRDFGAPVLRFEGYNIARFAPSGDGHRMLSREITVYENSRGDIIDCFDSRAIGGSAPVRVLHVSNDPVNFTIGAAPFVEHGDELIFNLEVQLAYPSLLPVAEYPRYSASNTYQSVELFNLYVDRADLEDATSTSAPVSISWTRVGQFLPWMQLGQSPGHLIYHARGYKLAGGWDDLPERLKVFVRERAPAYRHAPSSDESPNATSWGVFKAAYDAGEYHDSCAD